MSRDDLNTNTSQVPNEGAAGSRAKTPALEAAQANARRPSRLKGAADQPRRDQPIALIYLRVSTKEQARKGGSAEGYSIPAQRTACYTKAAALGAVVDREYVDAGESARSADRDELQRMLRDIKVVRPDYVIVHKIDRLARNRADDIAINLTLSKYGVKLVSCTENIDDTPTGRLLYGLLAEISQFYSGNLAQEVLKGMIRKAEEGGTPFRAPLGYFNRRELRGGIEFAWVELDAERAEIIRWCFEQYATGEWSGIDLTLAAQAKGLTSRPTPTKPANPISLTTMYAVLANPYYMGVVSYRGIHYEGKHPVLVEPEVWLAVQDTLAAHNHTGEKDRIHTHYLRSTIYCSDCGGRLVYSENTGNGGTYVYYMCVKRKTKTNNCRRPAMRLEQVEAGIADFYTGFALPPHYAEQIRAGVRAELAGQQEHARASLLRAKKRRTQVENQRQVLLRGHYSGAIPQDLLASEMQRLTRELAQADAEIAAAQTTTHDLETTLDQALRTATHCERAYLTAPDSIRRQLNQGFFVKLFIGEDGSVARTELTEPFAALLTGRQTIPADTTPTSDMDTTGRTTPTAVLVATFGETVNVTASTQTTTPRKTSLTRRGLNETYLVDLLTRYSNQPDTLHELEVTAAQLAQAERADVPSVPSVRSSDRKGYVRSLTDRLDQAEVRAIVEGFRSGTPRWQLAEQHKISVSSVARLLRREGVDRYSRRRVG